MRESSQQIQSFLESLRRACAAGLPVYAECGGLMLLARVSPGGNRLSHGRCFSRRRGGVREAAGAWLQRIARRCAESIFLARHGFARARVSLFPNRERSPPRAFILQSRPGDRLLSRARLPRYGECDGGIYASACRGNAGMGGRHSGCGQRIRSEEAIRISTIFAAR